MHPFSNRTPPPALPSPPPPTENIRKPEGFIQGEEKGGALETNGLTKFRPIFLSSNQLTV